MVKYLAVKYTFNDNNEFIIEDYDKALSFASFLPGIAGINGIPMWSYYCNRAQCMSSFGIKDKNNTIMEFVPANQMYRNTELQGFRTFIKCEGKIHEIFSSTSRDEVKRKMIIEKNRLAIEEENKKLNIKVKVTYFIMPNEDFAALVRKVEVVNLCNEHKDIEIFDGLTQILPFGVSNDVFMSMSNLFKAWFDVYNMENNIPFYKIRATTSDSAQIDEIDKGNFYLSFSSESKGLIPVIVDMDVIFGSNTSLRYPEGLESSLKEICEKTQITENKISGGFTAAKVNLKDNFTLCTLIGHISSPQRINEKKDIFNLEYIEGKEKEAASIVEKIVEDTFTKTSNHIFDKYVDQCYLDNILRGGYPILINTKEKNLIYHVFSRKHGDTEREYNFFSLEPTFYSQGNGSYRDVNQNRRNDVYFNPFVKDFNVKQFMNLIQIDGYNPLSVKGTTFLLQEASMDKIINLVLDHKEKVEIILKERFTPGKLMTYIAQHKVKLKASKEEFLNLVLENSTQNIEAEYGEGYWSDHFSYNMDLIETYLDIYPDTVEAFVFNDNSYRFYDSYISILPRCYKYVLLNGKVRQYDAVIKDVEKINKLNMDINNTNWLKTKYGIGTIYETNLYVKLISLCLNKFVTLDPFGIGIEMEANKPGWNDAMNGLPGLFGSGVSETSELQRILEFIIEVSSKYSKEIKVPIEIINLLKDAEKTLDEYNNDTLNEFQYWDKISLLREEYRKSTRFGINGLEHKISTGDIKNILEKFNLKVNKGISKAVELGHGICPTYLTYEAESYEIIEGKVNPVNGYENVGITKFKCHVMPLFLEGPARVLKSINNTNIAKEQYRAIKESEIYDKKLKMYKTSVPLDQISLEAGRARAFTAGWLERESIFMHMEYKYILSLIKCGLYDEFYEDLRTILVPFMDPKIYGRSTLENSSFIASSVNPDESIHGRGFVARLSGTTSEFLSIWFYMMAGKNVFTYDNNKLKLKFSPVLPSWLFDENGEVSFKFLGKTLVTYHNHRKANTYGQNCAIVKNMVLITDDKKIHVKGDVIEEPYAVKVRNGEINKIHVYLF